MSVRDLISHDNDDRGMTVLRRYTQVLINAGRACCCSGMGMGMGMWVWGTDKCDSAVQKGTFSHQAGFLKRGRLSWTPLVCLGERAKS
jgi:hypothetical protein